MTNVRQAALVAASPAHAGAVPRGYLRRDPIALLHHTLAGSTRTGLPPAPPPFRLAWHKLGERGMTGVDSISIISWRTG